MSVLFLPPSAGAASVPDASETVKGIIRIATSAEATAGTDDLTSMTPAKVKSVVDAAVAGGVTYKGTFDAAAPLDLSNAVQGDLYIIDGAGTYQGKTWAVGDHLLVNADMGGTVDPAKIDKIDSTDSVTSVAGRTGAVVLSTADISGLATVATSGAYSDLSGTPSLATVATTGAYSDLSGTPDIPDFQTITVNSNTTLSSSLEDGCYLIMIGSGATVTIPAYPTGKSLVFRFVSFGAGTCTIQQASGGTRLYEFGNSGITGVNSVNVASGATRTFHLWAAGSTVGLNYWSEASPSSTGATVAALDDIGDVDTTGVSTNNVLKYDGANWVDGSVAYSEVTGTPTLATVATTGAYSDLTGTPTLGTAAALDVGTSANNVVQLDGTAKLPAVDGSQLTNLPSGASTLGALSDVDVTGAVATNVLKYDGADWVDGSVAYSEVTGTPTLATVATTGAYSDLSGTPSLATVATTGAYSDLSGTPTLGTAAALDVGTSANNVVQLDGTAKLPAVDGSQLTNLPSGASTLGALSDVDVTGAVATNVLKYDGADWVDGSVAYSEVTGTPTLGTAAALDVGTSANNVVQLNGSAQLPAVDGSLLTNLPSGGSLPTVTTQTGSYTIPSRTAGQLSLTVLVDSATPVTVDLPSIAAGDVGFTIHVKRLGAGAVTVDAGANYIEDGTSSTHIISTQYDSRTFQAGTTTDWYII